MTGLRDEIEWTALQYVWFRAGRYPSRVGVSGTTCATLISTHLQFAPSELSLTKEKEEQLSKYLYKINGEFDVF